MVARCFDYELIVYMYILGSLARHCTSFTSMPNCRQRWCSSRICSIPADSSQALAPCPCSLQARFTKLTTTIFINDDHHMLAPALSTASISASDHSIRLNLAGSSSLSQNSPFWGSTEPSSLPLCPPMAPYGCVVFPVVELVELET
jgi:hypothetical protein